MKEFDFPHFVVDGFAEVEEVEFEEFVEAVEGRAVAEVGDAGEDGFGTLAAGADGVDAEFGAEIVAEFDVRGGEADFAGHVRALDNFSCDGPWTAQNMLGCFKVACLQGCAGAGGRHDFARGIAGRGDFCHLDVKARHAFTQGLHAAGALVAEDEIKTGDDVARAVILREHCHEIWCASLSCGAGEGERDDVVDAEGAEKAILDRRGGEAEGGIVGAEERARVGLQREDVQEEAEAPGLGLRGVDHGHVATVDAVEIAEGEDAGALGVEVGIRIGHKGDDSGGKRKGLESVDVKT